MAKTKSSDADISKLSFEEALEELTRLVKMLESGQLPLEESVAAFEKGVKLSRRCDALLEGAEQRLQVLTGQDQENPS